MMLLRMPIDMSGDGLHLHDPSLSDATYAARAHPSLAHSHATKRRRTSYLTSQHDSNEYSYGAAALPAHDARGYTAYSQPGTADTQYFLMQETAALSQSGQPHQHQHQHQLYQHADNGLDQAMSGSYQPYIPESTILNESSAPSELWDPQLFDTGLQLKVQSLPVLDNLATRILETLAHTNLREVIETATQPDSGGGQAYSTLVALFDQTKKYYSREHLFLNPQLLNLDPSANGIIRKANLATFAVAIFSARDVPFAQLHEHCLDVFLPDGRPLTKHVADLLLELKTQAYISALHNGGVSQKEFLEYFPTDMQGQLARRRPGTPTVDPVEQDLTFRVNVRRQQILNEQYNSPQMRPLYNTWKWSDLLQVLNECLRQAPQHSVRSQNAMNQDYSGMPFANEQQPEYMQNVQATPPQENAAFPMYQDSAHMPQRTLSNKSIQRTNSDRDRSVSSSSRGEKAPMQLQYEKARQSATSKATPPSRRVSVASQRKPWSQEEEKALMDGLDRVKGPHWSQILALYGVGGRISDVLRDRTQVQLKDKARNLKLFFLKSGIEVPTYLQGVTGELKTRAPAQAAKREREEKLKVEREELERQQREELERAREQQEQQRPP